MRAPLTGSREAADDLVQDALEACATKRRWSRPDRILDQVIGRLA